MGNRNFSMNTHRSQSGFALLESLISFLVLAVGLLALLSFHQQSQVNIAEAKAQGEAVAVAEKKLQELESFVRFSFSSDTVSNDLETGGSDSVDGVNVDTFNLTWTIDDDANGYVDPSDSTIVLPCESSDQMKYCLKTITVVVTWEDRAGDTQQVEVQSEINFHSPSEESENFIAMLAGTVDVIDSLDDGYNNPFGEDNDADDLPGGTTPEASIHVDDYIAQGGTLPVGYELNRIYIFKVTVSGSIARDGGEGVYAVIVNSTNSNGGYSVYSADGETVYLIPGDNTSTSATAGCTSSNTEYLCNLYYHSFYSGWNGEIDVWLDEDAVLESGNFDSLANHLHPDDSVGRCRGRTTYSDLNVSVTNNVVVDKWVVRGVFCERPL